MKKTEKFLVDLSEEFLGEKTTQQKLKKLGEEVVELAIAVESGNTAHAEDELGDCIYILLQIAKRINKNKSLLDYARLCATKMVMRRTKHGSTRQKTALKKINDLL